MVRIAISNFVIACLWFVRASEFHIIQNVPRGPAAGQPVCSIGALQTDFGRFPTAIK